MTVSPFRPKTKSTIRQFDIDVAIDRFLSVKRVERRSAKTIQAYTEEFSRLRRWLETEGLPAITGDLMIRYIHYLTYDKVKWDDHPTNPHGGVGLSARTVNNTIRNLKVLFNWCVREGYLTKSPMNNVRYQLEDSENFQVFSDEQVMRLLQQPNRRTFIGIRDRCMMLCLTDTGIRIGELTSLKVSDCDFELNQIILPAAITKNGHTRIAPISPTTSKELRELISYCNLEEDDFLWITQFGERYMGDTFAKMLKKYAKQAGIRHVRVSPHTFRHYFATKFLLNGGDPISLQRILGHRDMHMVSIYVNYTKADIRAQHEKFSPVTSLQPQMTSRKRGRVRVK